MIVTYNTIVIALKMFVFRSMQHFVLQNFLVKIVLMNSYIIIKQLCLYLALIPIIISYYLLFYKLTCIEKQIPPGLLVKPLRKTNTYFSKQNQRQ